jgi:hypothetical protein
MRSPVTFYLRIPSAEGSWIYVPPIYSPNHKLKPLCGLIEGVPKRRPVGSYYLRYCLDGKRHLTSVGNETDRPWNYEATVLSTRCRDALPA